MSNVSDKSISMELISTHVCKVSDVGFHGNLFGGQMLAWLDEAAAAYVCQMCDSPQMVTVKVDTVHFKLPVRPHQIIKIYSGFTIQLKTILICICGQELKVIKSGQALTELIKTRYLFASDFSMIVFIG